MSKTKIVKTITEVERGEVYVSQEELVQALKNYLGIESKEVSLENHVRYTEEIYDGIILRWKTETIKHE